MGSWETSLTAPAANDQTGNHERNRTFRYHHAKLGSVKSRMDMQGSAISIRENLGSQPHTYHGTTVGIKA